MGQWICRVCGYVYDENKGILEERARGTKWVQIRPKSIEPGARWEEIPGHFACPECWVSKTAFKPID